ncbi:MAG: sensor histidine kinase [Vicinamibacteria bacterium]
MDAPPRFPLQARLFVALTLAACAVTALFAALTGARVERLVALSARGPLTAEQAGHELARTRLLLVGLGALATLGGAGAAWLLARRVGELLLEVEAKQGAIAELNRDLERKVSSRTADLERANQALRLAYDELKQAETRMALSGRLAGLGQLVAGIAHEINTPSSAINAAIFNIRGYLDEAAADVPRVTAASQPPEMEERYWKLVARVLVADGARARASTADIRQRCRDLEPILAAAGFHRARELALTFSRLGLHAEIAELGEAGPPAYPAPHQHLLENVGGAAIAVNDIRVSIEAITHMVKALKSYSHLDQAETAEADVHDGIETTLVILRNQLRYGVVVERRFRRVPPVRCNAGELNQVWTNIIHNAIQAMRGMGRIVIETGIEAEQVCVRIIDDGPGIPAAVLPRVFEPFFTTKDQGEGSGLGLGICQQIVERLGGAIAVTSEPGRTCFEVRLPAAPGAAGAGA